MKEYLKTLLLKLKYSAQKFFYPPLPANKERFIKPAPLYVSQIADANRSSIEKEFSEIKDFKAAERFGAKNLEEFSFWAWRSCTLTCLLMIIKTLTKKKPKIMDLISNGIKKGGYLFWDKNGQLWDLGWKHKEVIQIAKEYSLKAKVIKLTTIIDLANFIFEDRPTIISLATLKKDTHSVLLIGVKTNSEGKVKGFYFHDPQNYKKSGQNTYLSLSKFQKRFANKAIVFQNKLSG